MPKDLLLDIQIADDLAQDLRTSLPTKESFSFWLVKALDVAKKQSDIQKNELPAEIGLRIVTLEESRMLNAQYRGKDKATNVLSFESDLPEFVPSGFLGDLVVCADIVQQETTQQQKSLTDHWAHLCIHGTLHLLGFDHIDDIEADEMEALEIKILAQLGIDDPYQIS